MYWAAALQEHSHGLAPGRSISSVHCAGMLVAEAAVEAGLCHPSQPWAAAKILTGGVLCPTTTVLLFICSKQQVLFTQFEGFAMQVKIALATL